VNPLDLKFRCMDFDGEITIREYLKKLLVTLWDEQEGFSGKRPFGNSGWEWDVYKPLIEAKLIPGKLDEDGLIDEVDEKKAHSFVRKLIETLN
jgi:hypothetical protein